MPIRTFEFVWMCACQQGPSEANYAKYVTDIIFDQAGCLRVHVRERAFARACKCLCYP